MNSFKDNNNNNNNNNSELEFSVLFRCLQTHSNLKMKLPQNAVFFHSFSITWKCRKRRVSTFVFVSNLYINMATDNAGVQMEGEQMECQPFFFLQNRSRRKGWSRQKKPQKMTQEGGCAASELMSLTQILLCTFFCNSIFSPWILMKLW